MTAIFGLVRRDGAPCPASALADASRALERYGRSGAAEWRGGPAGLGIRRAGARAGLCPAQPLRSPDRRLVLVSDGRLDSRGDLARDLGLAPAAALSDGELILAAYERWGTACAGRLLGDWTFAVWEEGTGTLVLARAPLASRALFIHEDPRGFYFASMPRGVHALSGLSRSIDEEHLADYLAFTGGPPERTFFRGVTRVLPGRCVVVRDGTARTEVVWRLDPGREVRLARDEEYVEAFDEVLQRAVADALEGAPAVGLMLSGGLDSSCIAAVAAPLLAKDGRTLTAFTEVPPEGAATALLEGRYADETPFVRALAGRYPNLELNLVRPGWTSYLDGAGEMLDACEVPFRNASNRPWYEEILRQAGARGVGTVLDGAQGNLTISWGGDGLLAGLVGRGRWFRAFREARAAARRGVARSTLRGLVGFGLLPLLPDPLAQVIGRLRRGGAAGLSRRAVSAIHPEFRRQTRVEERAKERHRPEVPRLRADTREIRARVLTGTGVSGDGMATGYEALFGVEQRAPAADRRVVELCLALPEDQCWRDGERRFLLRRAMAGRLPPEILDNPRRGLQAACWYESLFRGRQEALAELGRLERTPLAARALDLPRLTALMERMPERPEPGGRAFLDYRGVVEVGLMTGRFLRWVESGA